MGGGGGRAFGACCFAGKLRSPAPLIERRPSPGPTLGRWPPWQPPCHSPWHSPRHRWRGVPLPAYPHLSWSGPLRGASRPHKPRPTGPPRGSGAAAPSGALRAIDPYGAAAFLADLRSAPPAAAISACPGCHSRWCHMSVLLLLPAAGHNAPARAIQATRPARRAARGWTPLLAYVRPDLT